MKDFRSLEVWKLAHQLALEVYRESAAFPREEQYGLTSQMRRAALSIPANIAEGCGKDTNGEFGRYLTIAMGSASELEYLLLFSADAGYLQTGKREAVSSGLQSLRRMLNALIQKVRNDASKQPAGQ
jgi:four helix bundle protein